MHLRRIAAVILVALDRPGEPPAGVGAGLEEGLAQRRAGAAEGDPLEALAVVAGADAADVALADDSGLEKADGPCSDAGLRPACAVWTRAVERIAQRCSDSARREKGVEEQRAVAPRLLDVSR